MVVTRSECDEKCKYLVMVADNDRVSFHFGEARFSSFLYSAIDPSIFMVMGYWPIFFILIGFLNGLPQGVALMSLPTHHDGNPWWAGIQPVFAVLGSSYLAYVFLSFNSICLSQYCC